MMPSVKALQQFPHNLHGKDKSLQQPSQASAQPLQSTAAMI